MIATLSTILLPALSVFGFYKLLKASNCKKENRAFQFWTVPLIIILMIVGQKVLPSINLVLFDLSINEILALIIPGVLLSVKASGRLLDWIISKTKKIHAFLVKQKEKLIHGSKKKRHSKKEDDNSDVEKYSFLYFYFKDGGKLVLDKNFVSFKNTLSYAAYAGGIVILAFVLLLSIGFALKNVFLIVQLLKIMYDYGPTLIIAVLLAFEFSWFLGGYVEGEADADSVKHKDEVAETHYRFDGILKEYKVLFKDRLISTYKEHNNYDGEHIAISKNNKIRKFFEPLIENLKDRKIQVTDDYVRAAVSIEEGKDTLVTVLDYKNFSYIVLPIINQLLLKSNIVVLCLEGEQELLRDYLQESFKQINTYSSIWKIAIAGDKSISPHSTNVTIVPINRDVISDFDSITIETIKNAEILIGFGIGKAIAKDYYVFDVFVKMLLQIHTPKQIIVISDSYKNLKEVCSKVFNVEFDIEHTTLMRTSNQIDYMVFNNDNNNPAMDDLLNSSMNRYISLPITLSIPSVKLGLDKIYIFPSRNIAWKDQIDVFNEHEKGISEFLGDGIGKFTVIDSLEVKENEYIFDNKDDFNVIIAYDEYYCLPKLLFKWGNIAKERTILMCVCSDYMLKDYFADNISFFLHDNITTNNIIPYYGKGVVSSHEILVVLSQMILRDTEEKYILELSSVINLSVNESASVPQIITKAIHELFNVDVNITNYLTVSVEEYFDNDRREYKTRNYYRLHESIADYPGINFPVYIDILDENDNSIGMQKVMKDKALQKFIQGESYVIDGKLYEIDTIDVDNNIVKAIYNPDGKQYICKQDKVFNVKEIVDTKSLSNIHVNRNKITFETLSVNMDVTVKGYYRFSNEVQFVGNKFTYIAYSENSIINRELKNKEMLKISIETNAEAEKEVIGFTITSLLNEMSKTFYNENYELISFCINGYNDSADRNEMSEIYRYHDQLTVEQKENENVINIYVIEDYDASLGIVNSFKNDFNYIIETAHDYLEWSKCKSNYTSCYLNYGMDELPSCYDYENASKLLLALIESNNSLNIKRKLFIQENKDTEDDLEHKECDICGTELKAKYTEMEDGRLRCMECTRLAIKDVEECQKMLKKVKKYLKERFNREIMPGLNLEFCDANKISELASGEIFSPTPIFDSRTVGLASLRGSEKSIYVENGTTVTRGQAILAHEITHIWQYESLGYRSEKMICPEHIEGHASWVEVDYLKYINNKKLADEHIRSLMSREDEYGRGYREIIQLLEEHNLKDPFELMEKLYKK